METTSCLIADIPQKVLADIVQTVAQQNNIEVIAQLPESANLAEFLGQNLVDVLIWSMP